MKLPGKRSYYATEESERSLTAIRQKYGFSTDSDAIRFALQVVAAKDSKVAVNNLTPTRKKGKW